MTVDHGVVAALTAVSGRLDRLSAAAEGLALLRAAARSGLLVCLLEPAPTEGAASLLGVTRDRMHVVLDALRAHGVVDRLPGDMWALTDEWRTVAAGATPLCLEPFLAMSAVRSRWMESALGGAAPYEALSVEDRLAVAAGVTLDPRSPLTLQLLRRDLDSLPDVVAALTAGGRALELGCGIGSRLTALVQAFPSAVAVGVELDPDLAMQGRARAQEMGLADRLTYVVGDATAFEADEPFDFVNWSQFFFPTATRAPALAAALAALRPGGWLSMPVIWPDEPVEDGGDDDIGLANEAIVMDVCGVPRMRVSDALTEVRDAGFVEVHAQASGPVQLVRGRRPAA